MSNKTIIAIAGGTGFVGQHVVRLLSQRKDFEIVLLTRSRNREQSSFDVVDLTADDWRERLKQIRPQIFFNFAVDYGKDCDLNRMLDANLRLPISLMKIAIEVEAKAFVSCDSFYTKFSRVPAPMMDYVLMKKSLVLWMEAASNKLSVLNLRLEHVYGPGDRADKFVTMVLRQLTHPTEAEKANGLKFTEGSQIRDFVAVSDVASAVSHVIPWVLRAGNGYTVADVGTGRGTALRTFVEGMKSATASAVDLRWGELEFPKDEIAASVADLSFLRGLGWTPEVDVHKGLAQLVREVS